MVDQRSEYRLVYLHGPTLNNCITLHVFPFQKNMVISHAILVESLTEDWELRSLHPWLY